MLGILPLLMIALPSCVPEDPTLPVMAGPVSRGADGRKRALLAKVDRGESRWVEGRIKTPFELQVFCDFDRPPPCNVQTLLPGRPVVWVAGGVVGTTSEQVSDAITLVDEEVAILVLDADFELPVKRKIPILDPGQPIERLRWNTKIQALLRDMDTHR